MPASNPPFSDPTVPLEAQQIATAAGRVGLWDWDILTNEVKWTPAVYAIHGVDPASFTPSLDGFTQLVHPEDLARVREAIRRALEEEVPYEIEFRILKPGGETGWVFTNATVVRQEGRPVRMIGATLDITATRHADDTAMRLAAIVESSDDAILSQDLNSIITSWNAGAERLYGYTAREIIGRPMTVLVPQDRADEGPRLLERIRRGERIQHYETLRRHKNGELIDVSLTVSPLKDVSGRVVGASKIARDITDRKRTERDRQLLAAIVESSDDAILSKDLSGIITSWNAGAQRLFGYTAEEIIDRPVTTLIPPDRQNEEPAIIAKVQRGDIAHYDTVRLRKDGRLIDVALTVSPIRDHAGRVIGASSILRDVTELKRAMEALRVSEERFRLLANHAPVGIFLSDQTGACVFVNDRWCEMAGLSAEQARGDGWTNALHPADRERVLAGWDQAVHRGAPSNSEFRFQRPDGSVLWLQGHAVQFRDGEFFRGYLGSCIDVTQRKQTELQAAFLHSLTDNLAALSEPDEILERAQAALGDHLEADRCYFFEMHPLRDAAIVRRDWHRPGVPAVTGHHRLSDFGGPMLVNLLIQPHAQISDVLEHPSTRRNADNFNALRIRSLATATVSHEGGRHLALAVSSRLPRAWTKEETDLIENVAARVWPLVERTRATQALRSSEQLYRAIGESIDYGVWVCDVDGRNIYCSDSFLRLVGMTQEQASNLGWTGVLHPDEVDATTAAWTECAKHGTFWEREHHFRGVDGKWHPILARGVPIRDDRGRILRWVGINLDISRFKEVERTAQQRMDSLVRLNEVGNKLVAEHDLEKIVQLVTDTGREASRAAFGAFFYNVTNDAGESYMLYTLSGVPREAFAKFPMPRATAMFGPTFRGEGVIRVDDVRQDPRYGKSEPHHGMPAGHLPVRSYLAVPVTSRSGEVLGGLFFGHPEVGVFTAESETVVVALAAQAAIAIDNAKLYAALQRELAEQRRTETMLRDSENRWRQLAEAMPHLVWTCRPDGYCDYLSPQWVAYTGVPELEQLGDGWAEFVHPDDRAILAAKWRQTVETGDVLDTEFRIRRHDGKYRMFKTRAVPIRDQEGRIIKWYGTNTDVEEGRRYQEAIRKSENQLRLVTDHAPVFLVQTDTQHRFKFVNRTYAERFGLARDEIIGRHISELTGPEAFATFKVHLEAALTGRRIEFEQEIPYLTLGRRWVHVIYEPERNLENEVVGVVAVIVDITNRKGAELELEKARDEALEASRAKDDFLAALSHELRTPLNPVLLAASDAANNPSLPREIRESFEMIRGNISLEARLIDDLLDLTRITRGKMHLERHPVDVHGVLRDAVANIRPEIEAKRMHLELSLCGDHPEILGDAVRLQQVLWNILKNAVKFTPEGGRVRVSTEIPDHGHKVRIEIADNGIGMSAGELGRVFEAFTQGEHAGLASAHRFGGLGLGLAISQKLVEQHEGRIYAASAGRNRGSVFVVELPLRVVERDLELPLVPPPAATQAAPAAGGSRVLLVEDHQSTRETLHKLLTRRNYQVTAAGSVTEAREIAAKQTFDFLVSDVGLPDGDGYQLMAEVRTLQPALRGVAISGYGMEEDLQKSHAAGFAAHLVKPVSITALEQTLNKLAGTVPAS